MVLYSHYAGGYTNLHTLKSVELYTKKVHLYCMTIKSNIFLKMHDNLMKEKMNKLKVCLFN